MLVSSWCDASGCGQRTDGYTKVIGIVVGS